MASRGSPAAQHDFDALIRGERAVDRDALFATLRAQEPVFFSERLDAWTVMSFEGVKAVLVDNQRFAPVTEGPGAAIFGRGLFHWTGREHHKKAGLVARHIRSPRAFTDGLSERVERITDTVLDALPLGEPVDFRARYAVQIPLLVICELTAISQADRLEAWYDAIMKGGTASIGDPSAVQHGLDAIRELKEFLEPIIAERRADPGDDLVSLLANATYDGAPLPEEEVISVVIHLLPAGGETTARVLTCAAVHLARHPDEWDRLRAARHDPTYVESFAAELLRYYPPIQVMTRIATAAAEVDGTPIARGDKLALSLSSANRDAARFADPDRFDASRWSDNPDRQFTTAADILPFGGGEHHCTGSRLAKAEIATALQRLADRVERIELLPHEEPDLNLFSVAPTSLPVVLHPARPQ